MKYDIPTQPATSGLRGYLWIIALLAIGCTILFAGLSARSSYMELQEAKNRADTIADFARYLEAGTLISAERGPANSYMAAPDGVRTEYREAWEQATKATDAALTDLVAHVPEDLMKSVISRLKGPGTWWNGPANASGSSDAMAISRPQLMPCFSHTAIMSPSCAGACLAPCNRIPSLLTPCSRGLLWRICASRLAGLVLSSSRHS